MCRPLIHSHESRRGSSIIVMADGVRRFGMQAAGVGGADGGRNIGRPVARPRRGCDSSCDGRRATPRPRCRAPLGPMTRLGFVRYPGPILGRTILLRRSAYPSDDRLHQGEGGGKEPSPHGRPQSPGELRCPGALDRDSTSPRSRRSDHDPLTDFAREDQH